MDYTRRSLLLIFVLALTTAFCSAQVITGTPPFGSFAGGPDVVNLANLNVHLNVPVFSRSGRGLPFNFYLTYDNSIWYPVTTSGTTTWTSVAGIGWNGSEVNVGSVVPTLTYSTSGTCGSIPHLGITSYSIYAWAYTDGFGTRHPFSATSTMTVNTCTGSSSTGFTGALATDLSGYSLSVTGITVVSLYSADGNLINTSAGSIQDRNGNKITKSSGVFTDTLGTTALTVSGSGTPASPTHYTYTAPSGANAVYTAYYTNYTLATNFGISTIHEGKSSAAVPLITSIVQADGAQYTFTYEITPSVPTATACTPYTGTTCTTGRIAAVTLPTGATIGYGYAGGNNGVLPDGSTATLYRVTPDGTWTYSQAKNTGAASTTTITDPSSGANQTVMQFQGIYQTAQLVYQGSSTSGTLLRSWSTCYNGNLANCATTAVSTPITQQSVFDEYGLAGLQCRHTYDYNAAGGMTEQDDYDYGPSGPGPLLRQILVTFASLSNITAFRQQVTVKNGSGTTVSQTNYNYDETTPTATSGVAQHVSVTTSRGNLTSINYPVSGLTSHFTYYDTGSANTSADVNGATTTYQYSSPTNDCQMAFPTGVSEPLSLSRSMTWNCTGGVPASLTDENNQPTTYSWNDPDFWRPASIIFPDGGQTAWTYNSQTSLTTTTKMNSSQNIVTTQLLDSLGRNKEQQLNSDPEGVVYQDTTYDPLGRVYTVSNPYRSTSDPTYGLTTYGYDPISRPTTVTLQDGSVISASYTNNTITATDPAGKKRTGTSDGLGRLTQVTEDPSGFGYVTTYSYDALSDLTGVTQNGSRQRSYVYDSLSRLTSETNPESGTTNYYYTLSGAICGVAQLCQRTDARNVTTTYAYDVLGRLTAKSYSDSTPYVSFGYDESSIWGATLLNAKGRLTHTSIASTAYSAFSYDSMGRTVNEWQWTPYNWNTNVSGSWPTTYSYDLVGNMTSYSNGVGVTFTQSFDTAVRPTGLTSSLVDSQHPAILASGLSYIPASAYTNLTLGNGYLESRAYNPRLQPTEIKATNGSGFVRYDFTYGYGSSGTNNGNLVSWNSTGWDFDFSRTYTYDSLNRLGTFTDSNTSQSCRGLSWTYDAWGNRTDQTVTGGSCPTFHQSANTNNRLPLPYTYDAAGNMTGDGTHTYAFDAENRLISVDNGSTASYVYDAVGRRAESNHGSWKMDFIHDLSGNVVAEWCTNCGGTFTGWATGYAYLGNQMVAQYSNSTTYFAQTDEVGSTRLLTDPGGNGIQSWDYLPYGELLQGVFTTDHLFTGNERDSETNFDHTQFRQYSSNLGRWMTPDPAGLGAVDPTNPQSWNRYAYVSNNPMVDIDPTGLGAQLTGVACRNPANWSKCPNEPPGISNPLDFAYGDWTLTLISMAFSPTSSDIEPNPDYWNDSGCLLDDCPNTPQFVTVNQYGNIGLLGLLVGENGPFNIKEDKIPPRAVACDSKTQYSSHGFLTTPSGGRPPMGIAPFDAEFVGSKGIEPVVTVTPDQPQQFAYQFGISFTFSPGVNQSGNVNTFSYHWNINYRFARKNYYATTPTHTTGCATTT
jgi:RHS repeat-associated protein